MKPNRSHVAARSIPPADPFPNNERFPLLLYTRVFPAGEQSANAIADAFETEFDRHDWPSAWRNGVFSFHHFHSNAHEVLGVYAGSATVQFGGPDGATIDVRAGDCIVVPAGVAHKRLDATKGLGIVGAYPNGPYPAGVAPDTQREGHIDPAAASTVRQVPCPLMDPLFGVDGPLLAAWVHAT